MLTCQSWWQSSSLTLPMKLNMRVESKVGLDISVIRGVPIQVVSVVRSLRYNHEKCYENTGRDNVPKGVNEKHGDTRVESWPRGPSLGRQWE